MQPGFNIHIFGAVHRNQEELARFHPQAGVNIRSSDIRIIVIDHLFDWIASYVDVLLAIPSCTRFSLLRCV